VRFGFVPPPFGALWGDIHRLLERAVKRGANEWGEVERSLEDGRAQLWLAVDPAPVAAMVTKKDGETLEIWLAGGAVMSGCVPFLETSLSAARQAGATNARIIGRKGWARVLAPYGWRPSGDELVKDLA
jgi:hypothetical protein